MTLLEQFLPVYDVSDSVATVVEADVETTWNALLDADLVDVGRRKAFVGLLGTIRVLPDLIATIAGGTLPRRQRRMRLRDMGAIPAGSGGWIPLGERPYEELALGLVGKFWRPIIQFVAVSRDDYAGFGMPGYAKTIYSLTVRPLDGGRTLLAGTMRTATTSASARRWFRRYWTFGVGAGAHVLVNGLLEVVRTDAERRFHPSAHPSAAA